MANIESTKSVSPQEVPKTDLLDVVKTFFRWKKLIVTSCLIAGIGSAVIVLLLPSYYQASTVFLAVSPDQATPELLFSNGGVAPELYGNESDIDRMLTIAESNELIDFLIDSFSLYKHYDIERGSVKADNAVRKTFRSLYEITKTKRDAIQLNIEDVDPDLAAKIAKATRERINKMSQELIKNSQEKVIDAFDQDIDSKENQLNILSDTLQYLRMEYGIYNTEAQSESLTSKLASTESRLVSSKAMLAAFEQKGKRFRDSVSVYDVKVSGLNEKLIQLNIKMDKFNEGLSRVLKYTRQYQEANKSLSQDKEKIKQYQATYQSDIASVMLVEEASVPLIKSRPFRTLIVLASVLIVFVFVLIGILLFEAYGDLNWKEIYKGQ